MPRYDIDEIRFGTDESTFQRAVDLYTSGKIKDFQEGIKSYTATVMGTTPYEVFVEDRRFDYGHCTCYLGQNNTLCKHIVAVATYAVKMGASLSDKDKEFATEAVCSANLGALNAEELSRQRREITHALRYIKAYDGPSRIWFSYQQSLDEGCRRLAAIVSSLPVSKQAADMLVSLLLRLDKKLCEGGVDDSDGTVGGFMESIVRVLQEFVKRDPRCGSASAKLTGKETCFGWEEPLVKMLDETE